MVKILRVLLAAVLVAASTGISGCAVMASPAFLTGSVLNGGVPGVSHNKIARAQKKLVSLGYDPGPIDGIMGPQTRRAIRHYQKDKGLEEDGKLASFEWNFPELSTN